MNLTIRPSRVTAALALVVTLLIALSLLEQFSKYYPQYGYSCCFVHTFYVDRESSFPTYYSVAALALCGVLLSLIAIQHGGSRLHRGQWAALAAIFFLLAIDERMMFHEKTMVPLRDLLGLGGIFHFAWVLPGMVFVATMGLAYFNFLRALPGNTRRLFALAGSVFVCGGLGMEMIGGRQSALHGQDNVAFMLMATVEETLETAGIVIFIHALLTYMESKTMALRLIIDSTSTRVLARAAHEHTATVASVKFTPVAERRHAA